MCSNERESDGLIIRLKRLCFRSAMTWRIERAQVLGVSNAQKPIEPKMLMQLISEIQAFSLLIIPRRLEDEPLGFE